MSSSITRFMAQQGFGDEEASRQNAGAVYAAPDRA